MVMNQICYSSPFVGDNLTSEAKSVSVVPLLCASSLSVFCMFVVIYNAQ